MPKKRNNSDSESEDLFRPLVNHFARIIKGRLVKKVNGILQDEDDSEDAIGPLVDHFEQILKSIIVPNFMGMTQSEDDGPSEDDRLIAPPKRVLTSLAVGADDTETTSLLSSGRIKG